MRQWLSSVIACVLVTVGCERLTQAVVATALLTGVVGSRATTASPSGDLARDGVPSEWVALEGERDWELDAIARRLLEGEPQAERFRCVVVLPMRDPNAFASEQGDIAVTEGLLERLQGRDEIAFVLAHELAHLLKGHPRNLERNPTRLERIRTEIERGLGGSIVGTGLQLLVNAVASYYSREREREADSEAVRLMAKAGFDPQAAERALRRLGEEQGLLSWFRSHPFLSERIDIVREARRRFHPAALPPVLAPPANLPPEVFVDWRVDNSVGGERLVPPNNRALWQRMMAETQKWFWSALMDTTQQGKTPFRPAKRWQRHRAQTLVLHLRLLDWTLEPIKSMDGWLQWQIQVQCRLTDADGRPWATGQVRFGTAFAENEPLAETLLRSAPILARRLARFVTECYRQG